MSRFIGRFAVMDGAARRVRDVATSKHCASFHGPGFHAEREDGDLKIYNTTDEYGNAAEREFTEEGNSGIRSSAGDSRSLHITVDDDLSDEEIAAQVAASVRGARASRPHAGRLDHGYCSDMSPAQLNALARAHYPIGIRPRRG